MKLCQQCIDAITKIHTEWNFHAGGGGDLTPEPVSESECEFWIHERLNEIKGRIAELTSIHPAPNGRTWILRDEVYEALLEAKSKL